MQDSHGSTRGFAVARYRKLVLLTWLVVLLAALPFTLKQTET